ncbi:DUF262 domain-containing protein [Lysinibacillus sphaericus]|uniref:DUF262 domain-containing protein n=1 Tax=Lysinibacillus sphaericus TaxID=1421 RepID=UPI003D7F200C
MGMDVTPDKQNINTVFSNTTYYIDFYQREYKWSNEPVYRLLDDVFYKFNMEYEKHSSSDIPLNQLIEEYGWYYLNTYVTNPVGGKLYIVDGQQRLTTITLILIKLMHLGNQHHSSLVDWLSQKIVGFNGFEKEFWMKHEQHLSTMKSLFEGKNLSDISTSSGITAVNMVKNFSAISQFLDERLQEKHKYESFVFYFLKRLVLINLNVEQTDVPMVFEVINDRGVKLKPYEILKGKLLGQVDKKELEHFKLNELWDTSIGEINREYKDEVDEFFMYLLRAKFANSIGDSRKYDKNNYHKTIFEKEVNAKWKLDHNPKAVKDFLMNEFNYFTSLYKKVLNYYSNEHEEYIEVYYNRLTEMDSQFLLTLSVCKLNDPSENEKIQKISYEVDRFYSLLQLQKGYDSNDYNEAIYKISQSIREQDDLTYIRKVFDEQLISMLSENRGLDIKEPISYQLFKDTGFELNKRFKRYFFARIEKFIAVETKMQMKQTLYDLVSNTGAVNGFHIEHILSVNKDNLSKFNNDNDIFERERNRLGGLLLLKGKDNISSSNESYKEKLKTYANTLYWNETLRDDTYKTKIDFKQMINNLQLDFQPMDKFGPAELEKRHKLLYDIIKIIWN